jgi:hypothetical protein
MSDLWMADLSGAKLCGCNLRDANLPGRVNVRTIAHGRAREEHMKPKRQTGAGRPTLCTPELVERLADHIAVAEIKSRILQGAKNGGSSAAQGAARPDRAGEPGWQGTAWALERIHPQRFSRPEIQLAQQINVTGSSEREELTNLMYFIRNGEYPAK